MSTDSVIRNYRRLAPVYDRTFGQVTEAGRRHVARLVKAGGGALLEVGVGTGLALRDYAPSVTVTGIDLSPDMLERAREKVAEERLSNVVALRQMDAGAMDFPAASFDFVVALHILSVVAEPRRVMAEIARVCRPGGMVLIVNHFSREAGVLAHAARLAAPVTRRIGWHSDFRRAEVMGEAGLELVDERPLPPMGMMTFLQFRRRI
ncbi:MAG: methyltransferase domain-containing protein [Paracoccaceae bacterium]